MLKSLSTVKGPTGPIVQMLGRNFIVVASASTKDGSDFKRQTFGPCPIYEVRCGILFAFRYVKM